MDKHMHMCVCRVAFLSYLFFSSSYLNFYNAEGGRGGCFPKFFLMPNKLKASKKYSISDLPWSNSRQPQVTQGHDGIPWSWQKLGPEP